MTREAVRGLIRQPDGSWAPGTAVPSPSASSQLPIFAGHPPKQRPLANPTPNLILPTLDAPTSTRHPISCHVPAAGDIETASKPPVPAQDLIRIIEDKLQSFFSAQANPTDVQNSWLSGFHCKDRPSGDPGFPLKNPSSFSLIWAKILILLMPGPDWRKAAAFSAGNTPGTSHRFWCKHRCRIDAHRLGHCSAGLRGRRTLIVPHSHCTASPHMVILARNLSFVS